MSAVRAETTQQLDELEILVTEGLGNNTYVLASRGEAVVVDAQRDVDRFIDAARNHGARIRFALETHVHNDYVSGARELASRTGAIVAGPARAGFGFEHLGLAEGDAVEVGSFRLVTMETPGHTPEHCAYLLYRRGSRDPVAVFTGGSLLVSGAGRTDLLGPDPASELAISQRRSLEQLASLPAAVQVLPTHGPGSACSSAPKDTVRTSSVGREQVENAALQGTEPPRASRPPAYFARVSTINRDGPPLIADPSLPPPIGVLDVVVHLGRGGWVIDARSPADFARGHIPGSINVELGPPFAQWAGSVIPMGEPLALVLPQEDEALSRAVTALRRIGFDEVVGYLAGGFERWGASRRSAALLAAIDPEEAARLVLSADWDRLVDVREPSEWEDGHVHGSRLLSLSEVSERLQELPRDVPLTVACAGGKRAAVAASYLARLGYRVRFVAGGGVPQIVRIAADRVADAG